MFVDVKIGDKFKLKSNNINYEVYRVHGAQNPNKPGKEEITIFLKQINPSLWNFGTNLFLSIPEQDLSDFFKRG